MKSPPSFIRVFLSVLAVAGAGLVIIAVCLGRDAIEKIATALLMPCGLLWLGLLSLTIQLWPFRKRENRSQGAWGALLCCLLYSLAGNGMLADFLATSLESPFVKRNPLTEPSPDQLVVLGGGGSRGANQRSQGNMSGDRLILAAQLYHRNPSMRIICTGTRIASMNSTGVDPAETSRDILVALGVPETTIEMSGGKNTSEELQILGKRFEGSAEKIGLLTSAWHLRRAVRLAERNGLNVTPLPADFRSTPKDVQLTTGQRIEAMIPSGGALVGTWSFGREYLGMLVGR